MAESRLIGNEKGNPTTDAATTWVDLSDITLTEGEPITEEHLLVTFTYNSRKNYSGDKPEGWGDWLRRQMKQDWPMMCCSLLKPGGRYAECTLLLCMFENVQGKNLKDSMIQNTS